ncbi:hypothetical protein [Stakelama saccharophila]|uniref:Uncharacterized protein n=1 Tax=Stakelama saccharophila TaxID=3075605 RepID=A0ABZ0B8R5_9SPHN|nr:hypothetical protein [Stakelama sp. W311]WNO53658.1 hypothetical protein RPR59_14690 [Stakelama sp. W311]
MEQIVERIAVTGDDLTPLQVLRYRFLRAEETDAGKRVRIGAERLALSSGEAVRPLNGSEFLVISTGLVRR